MQARLMIQECEMLDLCNGEGKVKTTRGALDVLDVLDVIHVSTCQKKRDVPDVLDAMQLISRCQSIDIYQMCKM